MSQRRREDLPTSAAIDGESEAPVRPRRVTLAYGMELGTSELPTPVPTETNVTALPGAPQVQATRDVEAPVTVSRETRRAVAQTIGAPPMTVEASIADLVKPHLSALSNERRDELHEALDRGEFVRAISVLDDERQRFPKNLFLPRAAQTIRDYATERLTKRLGGLEATPMLFKPTLEMSAEARTILKLANGVSTIDDVLHASPLSRLRTSEILVDLLDRGALALRNASEARRPSNPRQPARRASNGEGGPRQVVTPSATPLPAPMAPREGVTSRAPRVNASSSQSGTRTKALPSHPGESEEPHFDLTTRRTEAPKADLVEVERIAVRGKMPSSPPKPPTVESSRQANAPGSTARPVAASAPHNQNPWIFPLVAISAVASVAALTLVLARPTSVPSPEAPKSITTATAMVIQSTTWVAAEEKRAEPIAPTTMMFSVEVTPEHARVFVDDVLLTRRPLEQALPRDGRNHLLRIEAPLHKTRQITFAANRDAHFVVNLERILPPSHSNTAGRARAPF